MDRLSSTAAAALRKNLRIHTRDAELFSSTQYLTELGQDLCDRPLASEKDLEGYQRLAVKRPTTHIISHLQRIEEARRAFNLGEGIICENHANTLSDSNEEVQQSLQNLRISSKGPASSSNPKPRNADQICAYKEADGTRSLRIVVEYKPSHKLSVFNLRARLLRANKGSMNIPEDVINRITIPTNFDVRTLLCSTAQLGYEPATEVLVYRGAVVTVVEPSTLLRRYTNGRTAIVDVHCIENRTNIKNSASSPNIHFYFIPFSPTGCTVIIRIHPPLIKSCPF